MSNKIVYAAEWMKPESRGHYLLSCNQITIRNTEDLNEIGRQKLDEVLKMVKDGKFKNTLYDARLQVELAGSWYNDRGHPGATEEDKNSSTNLILNSPSNLVMYGTFTPNDSSDGQKTSIIRFMEKTIDFKPTWIYTMSGSLYQVVMSDKF